MMRSFSSNIRGRHSAIPTALFAVTLLMLFLLSQSALCAEHADFIVAKDGTGSCTTVQAAIDSVPANSTRTWVILIRRGTYKEKLFIEKNNIALVGEDRDSTRIVFAELRKNWRAAHDSADWGSAVINVGNSVRGLTLANLTVYNNYGSQFGDHDHQFAIRGGGSCSRIWVVNCNILADGGDTMSLWNTKSGMYYHSGCFFSGYVDFVCPRGWCYITDSKFFGYTRDASIWHDGSADSTSRFVIRNSLFDGIPGAALGRNHREAQFFLLDCTFSPNIADKPIYQVKPTSEYKWGGRYYYWNCHHEGGEYSWYKDNLDSVPGAPLQESDITAFWTFGGKWDPERTMPAVLPYAAIPTPRNHGVIQLKGTDSLRWIGARNAVSYNVYFGSTDRPQLVRKQNGTFYIPGNLAANSTYYWRIDTITETDTIPGSLWTFTTGK